ncbi:MAG: pirin family protein [Candidatus Sericytochromatia bacterium]|nr:pirin family protein [Candidatus Sericytochromatia bacterium]
MLTVRHSADRGHANHGWLDSFHTFSFADYFDPAQMGYRALRVINEDRVAPGQGFGTHPHRDMEILTYVLSGGLAHKDSMGNGSTIRHGDVQRMTAGTGVTHSEFNGSHDEAVHLLQIWILPEAAGLTPGYEEKHFAPEALQGQLRLIAAPDGADGAVTIHQDVRIYAGTLSHQSFTQPLDVARYGWLQVATGSLSVNGTPLAAGDAVAIQTESQLRLDVPDTAEVVFFDLA